MKQISKYFVSGLLFILPLIILYQLLVVIASIVGIFVSINIIFDFLIALVVITTIGFIVVRVFKKYLKRRMLRLKDSQHWYGPLISLFLQVDDAGNRAKKAFSRPALYKVDQGIYKLGYITDDSYQCVFSDDSSMPADAVWVYVPFPINFFGDMLLVQRNNIQMLNEEEANALPLFILSGGLLK